MGMGRLPVRLPSASTSDNLLGQINQEVEGNFTDNCKVKILLVRVSMSHQESVPNPPFRAMVRANGTGEVWTHSNDDYKLNQFGWRCTKQESAYRTDTLIGNWNEERFDVEKMRVHELLPSQKAHYYDTIHNSSYNTAPRNEVPSGLKFLNQPHPRAYSSLHPELDSEKLKGIYNSWQSTHRGDYLDPRLRQAPVKPGQTSVPLK